MRYATRMIGGGVAAAVLASGVMAQEPPPFPEFSFRRVAAPAPDHQGPRIDIQIEPRAPEPERAAAPEPPRDEAAAEGPVGWFWAVAGDGLDAPGRVARALDHLSQSPQTAALNVPGRSALRAILDEHGAAILARTAGTDISPALVLAVVAVESAGRADALSHAGAQGLMQLIPATAERFAVADAFDPDDNISGGVAYLAWLLEEFGRDPVLALAGYNAGEGAVWDAGGIPPYAETRAYVPKVLAAWAVARELCLRPPETPLDPCVFATMVAG